MGDRKGFRPTKTLATAVISIGSLLEQVEEEDRMGTG